MSRSATLTERAAFLLVLFGRNKMYHGSYIVEKMKVALAEGVKPATLEAMLDEENRKRYKSVLDPRLWKLAQDANVKRFAWERAWDDPEESDHA